MSGRGDRPDRTPGKYAGICGSAIQEYKFLWVSYRKRYPFKAGKNSPLRQTFRDAQP